MHVDYLIVGQGICGTLLSWFLHREGKSFLVMDRGNEQSSSRAAAGIINPVTGRRYARSWMIEEVMPFAVDTYEELGRYLGEQLVSEKNIIDFFPSPQMRETFIRRLSENDTYLHSFPDQNHFNSLFHYDFGCGQIRPAYTAHLGHVLSLWRKKLEEKNALRAEDFDSSRLQVEKNKVLYDDFSADRIIFCEGAAGIRNPWFGLLPYALNKGEALIMESSELPREQIFKKGLLLAPLAEKGQFWVGSNYQWEFAHEGPSPEFYRHTCQLLDGWLKHPYRIIDHRAAVRPATLERRPFIGFHPQLPVLGILNGMGTKGASLAPFFSFQLVQHLVHGLPLLPEADVNRFSRILAR